MGGVQHALGGPALATIVVAVVPLWPYVGWLGEVWAG